MVDQEAGEMEEKQLLACHAVQYLFYLKHIIRFTLQEDYSGRNVKTKGTWEWQNAIQKAGSIS